ncbi:MAG: lysophospholipase [Pontiella sp.]|nr:lysophospholipase [Pontiella sp.]
MPLLRFILNTADGLTLHGQGWEPDTPPNAVVCLIHGLGEHCGRYDHVGEIFNEAGIALLAFDLRGHGRSEGRRGHAPSYAALMADIALLLNEAASRYPNTPRFLYGHSLGGNLVIHHALTERPPLAGVIATAPLLRLAYNPPGWKTLLLRSMRALRINMAVSSGLDDTALARDINVVRTYRNDPLTHNRITASLAVDMLRYGEWNLQHAADFPCPLLLMHGGSDRITSAAATREFASRTRADCTLKIREESYHELHNEPGKNQVLHTVVEWMEQHVRALHSESLIV